MSLSSIFSQIEQAAEKTGIALEDALKFLAHFSAVATPVAQVVETATGNAELAPLTGVVNATIQSANTVVQTANGFSTVLPASLSVNPVAKS